jgi:chromosome segregation ATPase
MTDVNPALAEAQKQLESERNNAKAMIAQLDATKAMFNESSNAQLQLRTNINIMNGQLMASMQKTQQLEAEIVSLKKQLEDLKKPEEESPEEESPEGESPEGESNATD